MWTTPSKKPLSQHNDSPHHNQLKAFRTRVRNAINWVNENHAEAISKMIRGMPRRLEAVLEVKGAMTKYCAPPTQGMTGSGDGETTFHAPVSSLALLCHFPLLSLPQGCFVPRRM